MHSISAMEVLVFVGSGISCGVKHFEKVSEYGKIC